MITPDLPNPNGGLGHRTLVDILTWVRLILYFCNTTLTDNPDRFVYNCTFVIQLRIRSFKDITSLRCKVLIILSCDYCPKLNEQYVKSTETAKFCGKLKCLNNSTLHYNFSIMSFLYQFNIQM